MIDSKIITTDLIINKILIIRNYKIILDTDLAELFQVPTKVLNQAVKRNINRFPDEFIFQLTQSEKSEVVTNCDHLAKLKFSKNLPFAFTEHGVAMLSTILNSDRAVNMSIVIIRTFIQIRQTLLIHKELVDKIEKLEKKQNIQGEHINVIHDILKHLIDKPENTNPIGFHRD